MRVRVAIGMATTIAAMSASTLSAWSGVGKGSLGWSIEGRRATVPPRDSAELTPQERIHLRATLGDRYKQLSLSQRGHLMRKAQKHVATLSPQERQRLKANAHEHVAKLSPRERERFYRRGLYYGRR